MSKLDINVNKIEQMKNEIHWKVDVGRDKVNIEGRDQVLGVRRSGNHFLIETLHANFKERFAKGHRPADIRLFKGGKEVYIIRDIRDVLCSCYRWWTLSGESRISGIRDDFQDYSFDDYVGGKVKIKEFIDKDGKGGVGKWDMDRRLISDPISHWINHVESYENENIPIVRYEDLKQDTKGVVIRLWKELDLTPKMNLFRRVIEIDRPVGYMPYKGRSGTWKEYFTEELEEYVWDRIGEKLEKFGYTKDLNTIK